MSKPPTAADTEPNRPQLSPAAEEFSKAAQEPDAGFIVEFFQFLRENRAWWLTPILLAMVLLGIAVWFASSPLAPFIYPLF